MGIVQNCKLPLKPGFPMLFHIIINIYIYISKYDIFLINSLGK